VKVLSIAYPLAPVTPQTAGGAEQVLLELDRALVAAGHESVVVAAAESKVAGRLVPLPAFVAPFTEEVKEQAWAAVRERIAALLGAEEFHVIHMHGLDFDHYLPETSVPVLVTLHLPRSWYSPGALDTRKNVFLYCVSQSQAGTEFPYIPNGVDLDRYHPGRRSRPYVFSMGRICPEKGFHDALDAAAHAGSRLIIAGEVYPYESHQRYFREQIEPRIQRSCSKFIGSVGPERKRRLLAGATAVLIPSTAPETSSLVAMESLACGTPVIAYPSGALADIVQHGQTGFLVRTPAEMASAIGNVSQIDRACCRAWAELHCDLRKTIATYISVYERLAH
jgi:glycosyltransferase involved in cell wall biosynthesis